MKLARLISLAATFVLALVLISGCSKEEETAAAPATAASSQAKNSQDKVLNVYIWSEYIDPEIVKAFEARTGAKVRIDVYEDTETMMAKLQHQGGDHEYDVVVVSDHAITVLGKLGTIRPLDFSKIPNIENVRPKFRKTTFDPEGQYFAAYLWGTQGIIYRKDRMKDFPKTWGLVFDEDKQPGPFVLIDSMRDMLSAALVYQGHSVNSTDPKELQAAADLIIQAKKSAKCVGFDGGVGGKSKVADGMANLAIVYGGDALRAMKEDANLGYFIPEEGSIAYLDGMTIPSHAPNPDLAYEFINTILDAQAGAQLAEYTCYATPNKASEKILSEKGDSTVDTYPDEEMEKKLQFIEDVGDATRLYDELWRTVKTR